MVFYLKSSEGVPYNDGTRCDDKADDAVPPGSTYTYVWPVPERAGPARMDGSSIMWMYHSHVNEARDINTGLMGAMIITRKGMARRMGLRRTLIARSSRTSRRSKRMIAGSPTRTCPTFHCHVSFHNEAGMAVRYQVIR